MPRQAGAWNTRTARSVTPDLEVLASTAGADLGKSIVLDASTVAVDPSDGKRRLKAGTLLSKNVSNQYERFTGAAGQVIRGVLMETIEFVDNVGDVDSSMWNHLQEFRADRIVDFATHGAAARAAMPTCRFI